MHATLATPSRHTRPRARLFSTLPLQLPRAHRRPPTLSCVGGLRGWHDYCSILHQARRQLA